VALVVNDSDYVRDSYNIEHYTGTKQKPRAIDRSAEKMDNHYFLTRQSANLMEDLNRQILNGSSLFLMYGDKRVGKTSLLNEFAQRRLQAVDRHHFDFAQSSILLHSSIKPTKIRKDIKLIEKVFTASEKGNVILLDHLEQASKKALQVLFQCWNTDGVDKKLNLVICCDQGYFSELKTFAAQFSISMQVMQLLPLKPAEVDEFVSVWKLQRNFSCDAAQQRQLQRNIKACSGKIGEINSALEMVCKRLAE